MAANPLAPQTTLSVATSAGALKTTTALCTELMDTMGQANALLASRLPQPTPHVPQGTKHLIALPNSRLTPKDIRHFLWSAGNFHDVANTPPRFKVMLTA